MSDKAQEEEIYKEDVQKMLAVHENDSKIIQTTIEKELSGQTDRIKQRLEMRKSSSTRTLPVVNLQPTRKRNINIGSYIN